MFALHCRIVERSSQVPLSNYHIQYGLDSHQTGKIRRELQKLQIFQWTLKVLESVSFFLGGKKCPKIVNIGVMRKDQAAQQRLFSGTILRGLTQPLNAYGYKYFSFVIVIVLPICSTCWSFSTIKISHCWRPNIFTLNWQKSEEYLNLSTFGTLEKN
jgi:hypothetical protein